MKKNFIILVCILLSGLTGFSQVAVNIDGSLPDNSAMLDVKSTTKGFLPPRMNSTQMYSLSGTAAEGLTIYNTTTKSLCVFDGTKWNCNNDGKSCGTVTYGGHTYSTVVIGTQCWFRENLNIGSKINAPFAQIDNSIIEKYCYNNVEANCDVYGGLYQWNEMMNYTTVPGQGICPTGWHLPTDDEFSQMELYFYPNTDIGSKLKETGTIHWLGPNTGTNTSGFTALGSGYKIDVGDFVDILHQTRFWSSTEASPPTYPNAMGRSLFYDNEGIFTFGDHKDNAHSVRCLKN